MQEAIFALTPSPNLSPKGERNMRERTWADDGGFSLRYSTNLLRSAFFASAPTFSRT
jgi:hypothetical protein